MALKLNERYPARFDNPSADYPQGSFKNRTSPTAKDGSYLEKDWANDKEGFFQSLMFSASIEANGAVDKVGSSQYYNALLAIISNSGVAWNNITNKPSTLGGYGITDSYTKIQSDARYPFSDNALTIGFVSSDVTKPYIQSRTNNQVYRLQPLLGQATESAQGTVAIATQAATNAGTDDAGAITAKKLKFGFASLFAANGYLKFPDWLGGFIIQWGNASIGDDTIVDVTLPISFPNSFFAAIATAQINAAVTGSNSLSATAYKKSLSTVAVGMNQGSTSTPATSGVDYICIGR